MSDDEIILSDSAIIELFQDFINNFSGIPGAAYPYFEKIQGLLYKDDKTLTLNHIDLPPELLQFFFNTNNVEYNLKLLTQAVQNLYREYYPDDPNWIQVEAKLSIDDKALLTSMRKIDIKTRSKLICFDATIVSKSERKSTLSQKIFKCASCGELYNRKLNKCTVQDCGSRAIKISITDSILTRG